MSCFVPYFFIDAVVILFGVKVVEIILFEYFNKI